MIRRPPRSKRTTHSFPTRRSSDLGFPDVPTMDEHGFKGFDASSWYGVVGPADMPKELALAINADINKVLLMPDVAQRFRSEEHTSELQSLMRISYAVFCLKKKIS